jgi:type II secretory pathway pseudopilin PulG
VEIMIVVAILGIIVAIAVPTFFRARELSRVRACQENMHKIDGAKQQWALDTLATAGATPDWVDLVGVEAYIRRSPVCPGSGTYTINTVADEPACSLSSRNPFPHLFEVLPSDQVASGGGP